MITSVSNEIMSFRNLETCAEATTKRWMVIPGACVYNSNDNTFAKDAPLVKLVHTCRVVRRVLGCRSIVAKRLWLYWCKLNNMIRPDICDFSKLQEAFKGITVCYNAGAAEDVAIKCLQNSDVLISGDTITSKISALSVGLVVSCGQDIG